MHSQDRVSKWLMSIQPAGTAQLCRRWLTLETTQAQGPTAAALHQVTEGSHLLEEALQGGQARMADQARKVLIQDQPLGRAPWGVIESHLLRIGHQALHRAR